MLRFGVLVASSLALVAVHGADQTPLNYASPHHNSLLTPELRTQIGERVTNASVPGYSLAVVRLNGSTELGSWGIRTEDNEPMTPDTLFTLASVSKQFTATAVGLIIDDYANNRNATPLPGGLQELSWKTKLKDILPGDWALQDKWASEKANLNDILSHVSGLPRHDLAYGGEDTALDRVKKLRYLKPEYELREKWHYNNHMYMLASHLVSVLANESFPSFVARRIFKPLGMKHSSFDPENVREDLVTHAWVGSPVDRRVPSLFSPQIARLVAGAGVGVSSAEDMSHWVGALLNALASKSEPPKDEVLPSAVLREVTRPQSLVGDGYVPSGLEPLRTTYGKGWFQDNYRGHRVVHHGGSSVGFSTLVTLFPDDGIGFVQLVNTYAKGKFNIDLAYFLADHALGLEPLSANTQEEITTRLGMIHAAPMLFGSPIRPATTGKTLDKVRSFKWSLDRFTGNYTDPGYGRLTLCSLRSASPECVRILSEVAPIRSQSVLDHKEEVLYASRPSPWSTHLRLLRVEDDDRTNGERVARFNLVLSQIFPHGYGNNKTAFEFQLVSRGDRVKAEFLLGEDNQVIGLAWSGMVDEETTEAHREQTVKERAEAWFTPDGR